MSAARSMRALTVAAAGVLALWLQACAVPAGAGARAAPPLRGTTWSLPNTAPPEMSPPGRASQLVLNPDLLRVTGNTGCNPLAGSFQLDGEKLVLSPVTTTRMACRPGDDDEFTFLQALAKVQRWQIDGRELTLSDGSGKQVLRLWAEPDKRR